MVESVNVCLADVRLSRLHQACCRSPALAGARLSRSYALHSTTSAQSVASPRGPASGMWAHLALARLSSLKPACRRFTALAVLAAEDVGVMCRSAASACAAPALRAASAAAGSAPHWLSPARSTGTSTPCAAGSARDGLGRSKRVHGAGAGPACSLRRC